MGSTRTTVGTSVSRVIEDKLVPDSVRTGLSKALFEEGEISEYLTATLAECIGLRAERMFDFAKRGDYEFGLPSGQFYTPSETGKPEVLKTLKSIEGVDVTLDYLVYGAPNTLHVGWLKLIDEYGYNPATNQLATLTADKGTPVYLDDMVVMVPTNASTDVSTLKQYGLSPKSGYTPERKTGTPETRALLPHSDIRTAPTATQEYVLVSFVWEVSGNLQRESIEIPTNGYNKDADYFQAQYRVGTTVKYWMYLDGAGTYPALDAVYDRAHLPNGSYFPFLYFRYNKRPDTDDKNSNAYKSGKKLAKYLGMDYDLLAKEINKNPDIKDVEQAMAMFAVPANTTNELERRYLWDYFNNMFLASPPAGRTVSPEEDLLREVFGKFSGLSAPGAVIQDKRFKLTLENSGIYKRRVAGKIGSIGSHTSGFNDYHSTIDVVDVVTGSISQVSTPGRYHYYRRQVSVNQYDEIQVANLRTKFYIFEGYYALGDDTDNILLIPLDRAITGDYSVADKERVYSRSLHYVFNSRVVTEVQWYQTGIFKVVMLVIAVVAAFFTYGQSLQTIPALIAAGSYAAAAWVIIAIIVKMVIVSLIFKLLVKAVGVEFAIVVALIAAVAGVVDAVDSGSIAGAPFASDLLMVSSNLMGGVNAALQDAMVGLSGEYSQFDLLKKEQTKLLEEAQKLLESTSYLSPFVIFGESPQDFYTRTVHSGNIGVVSIEAVSMYVDMQLTLPKLNDTLGGNIDE